MKNRLSNKELEELDARFNRLTEKVSKKETLEAQAQQQQQDHIDTERTFLLQYESKLRRQRQHPKTESIYLCCTIS